MASADVHRYHVHSAYYRLVLIDGLMFLGAFYLAAYLYFLPEPSGLSAHTKGLPSGIVMSAALTTVANA